MNTARILFTPLRRGFFALLGTALIVCGSQATIAEDEEPAAAAISFDDLKAVENPRVAAAWVDPEADWSVFKRIALLEPYVAFRANWRRDTNRSRTTNVSTRDMERIKSDVGVLFQRVFVERLEAAGYEVVDHGGEDVLLLRPAIIDLDVTAPDVRSAGRTRNFTTNSGAATLYMELFDSYTGDILGRAVDRREVRSAGSFLSWSNSVTNNADARRMFGRWADKLIEFLDSHYKK